jgi:hypothetical protein
MKLDTSVLLAASCLLATTLLHAQNWQFERQIDYTLAENQIIGEDPQELHLEEPGTFSTMALSSSTPAVGLTGNDADEIYPEIQNLADSLKSPGDSDGIRSRPGCLSSFSIPSPTSITSAAGEVPV